MMKARMTNPVMVLPDAMKALLALSKAAQSGTVPQTTHTLIHLRVSQINGCGVCVDMHSRELKHSGEKDERIWGVGAWRESTYCTSRMTVPDRSPGTSGSRPGGRCPRSGPSSCPSSA